LLKQAIIYMIMIKIDTKVVHMIMIIISIVTKETVQLRYYISYIFII